MGAAVHDRVALEQRAADDEGEAVVDAAADVVKEAGALLVADASAVFPARGKSQAGDTRSQQAATPGPFLRDEEPAAQDLREKERAAPPVEVEVRGDAVSARGAKGRGTDPVP